MTSQSPRVDKSNIAILIPCQYIILHRDVMEILKNI